MNDHIVMIIILLDDMSLHIRKNTDQTIDKDDFYQTIVVDQ